MQYNKPKVLTYGGKEVWTLGIIDTELNDLASPLSILSFAFKCIDLCQV